MHCALLFTVKTKIIKKASFAAKFLMNSKGTRSMPPDHMPVFSQIPTSGDKDLSLMRQQHAFSLSTRFFFPRRHFASALSRQGRLLFWLISVFLLFFQNKSQGRHNITTYPKKIYRRVHHGPQTYHSCDQTTLQTK